LKARLSKISCCSSFGHLGYLQGILTLSLRTI